MVAQSLLCIVHAGFVIHDVRPVGSHCQQHLTGSLIQEAGLEGGLGREAEAQLLHPLNCLMGMAVDPGVGAVKPDIGKSALTPGTLIEITALGGNEAAKTFGRCGKGDSRLTGI